MTQDFKTAKDMAWQFIEFITSPALVLDKQYKVILQNDRFIEQFCENQENILSSNLLKSKLTFDKHKMKQFLEECHNKNDHVCETEMEINGSLYTIKAKGFLEFIIMIINAD